MRRARWIVGVFFSGYAICAQAQIQGNGRAAPSPIQQQQAIDRLHTSQLSGAEATLNAGSAISAVPVESTLAKPAFSVAPGTSPGIIVVKLKAPRGAKICYTADGWTPTEKSPVYTGPITLAATTHLEAVSLKSGFWPSEVAKADYALPSTSGTAGAAGMVKLRFDDDVLSRGLHVGDRLPVVLAEDLVMEDGALAPKGSPVLATVAQAFRLSVVGGAARVSFTVHSVTADGRTVLLTGGATKETTGAADLRSDGVVIARGATLRVAVVPSSAAAVAAR